MPMTNKNVRWKIKRDVWCHPYPVKSLRDVNSKIWRSFLPPQLGLTPNGFVQSRLTSSVGYIRWLVAEEVTNSSSEGHKSCQVSLSIHSVLRCKQYKHWSAGCGICCWFPQYLANLQTVLFPMFDFNYKIKQLYGWVYQFRS